MVRSGVSLTEFTVQSGGGGTMSEAKSKSFFGNLNKALAEDAKRTANLRKVKPSASAATKPAAKKAAKKK